jgi:hypothetical protein
MTLPTIAVSPLIVQRLTHDRSRHVVSQFFGIVIDPIQRIQELSVQGFARILQRQFDGLANQMSPEQLVFAEQFFVRRVVVSHPDAAKEISRDARRFVLLRETPQRTSTCSAVEKIRV